MTHGATPEAIHACETAVRRDFYNPDLYLNLGRVYVLSGKTSRALATFERGLALSPNEQSAKDLQALLEKLYVPKPYILGGHSFGGYVARLFASMLPDDTGGLILEDTQHEDVLHEMRKILEGKDARSIRRTDDRKLQHARTS